MKTLSLYLGATLVVTAIAGAVLDLMDVSLPLPESLAQSLPQSVPEAVVQWLPESVAQWLPESLPWATPAAEPPPPPAAAAVPPSAEPEPVGLTPAEIRAQDEEDIIKILLAQIEATPRQIDDAWIAGFCQFVRNGDDLRAYWDSVRTEGERYNAQHPSDAPGPKSGSKKSRASNPLVHVFAAREFIYSGEPKEATILGQGRSLIAMAVYLSWKADLDELRQAEAKKQRRRLEDVQVPNDAATIDEDVKTAYFSEMLKVYDVLAQIVVKAGGDPTEFRDEKIRLHEAAIVDRHLLVQARMQEARERYADLAQSSAPATVAIARADAEVNAHILALGKIYNDMALHEMAFRGRQQEYAERGFRALALVYQRSKSGESLRVMRESNRIMRYNLWQMARASWKSAKAAAKSGHAQEADDQFFTAKQLYLKCLSMLERSRKPVVLDEYQRLHADIAEWTRTKGARAPARAG